MKKLKKILLGMLTATVMLLMLGLSAGAASKVTGITLEAFGIGQNIAVKGGKFTLHAIPKGKLSAKDPIYDDFATKAKVSISVKKNKNYVSGLKKNGNSSKYCTAKKAGIVTFEAKATYKGKTYKTSCKVWIIDKTPIKSLVWDDSLKLSKDNSQIGIYSNKGTARNLSITANKGWKITEVSGVSGYKIGEDYDNFLNSYELNTSTYKTKTSYTGKCADIDILLESEKDGKKYNVYYRVSRQRYSQYELTYKAMKNGTTIQLGSSNVQYRYNKKAKSEAIITRMKDYTLKYTIEFKSLKDLQKKMSTYRYGNLSGPAVPGEFRISGNKLIMKVPYDKKVKLINPGKGTTLKKTV